MTIYNISNKAPSFRVSKNSTGNLRVGRLNNGQEQWRKIWHTFYLVTFLSCLLFGFAAQAVATNQININEADAETISASVTGIGPVRAQAIVAYRNQFGKFKTLDEMLNVPGIGRITLDAIKPFLSLGESDKSALIKLDTLSPNKISVGKD